MSSEPSMPSVSAAIAAMPGWPSSATASASRNSALRPPRPPPRTVTVVSPPERSTQGGSPIDPTSPPKRATWRAIPACTCATSRASPSIESPRITGATPAARATSAAARSASCAVASMITSLRANRGSPGFGVSSFAARRCSITACGSSIPYFASTASASANVVGSGTVGPDAITDGSSPGTSEIASVTTRAGAAAAASRPPLIAERCLRTQFISVMFAPDFSSARFTACLSSSVRPSAGAASRAEPPPEMRQRTRSSGPSPFTSSSMRAAARRPAASGTGCAASTTSIFAHGTPWP